jgi:hypothetical protein
MAPYGTGLLVLSSTRAGKSSLTLGLLERLAQSGYQYCLLDPEGDYEDLPDAVNLGDVNRVPTAEEVLDVLDRPEERVAISLLGVHAEDRPGYLADLLPQLASLRAQTARPHWLVLDEAHHLLPSDFGPASQVVPREFGGLAMITLRASLLAPAALALSNTLCCVGQDPAERIKEYCALVGEAVPALPSLPSFLEQGVGLFWRSGWPSAYLVDIQPSHGDRKRHRRKYAVGELNPELSFYFRGPEQKLNLRAQNLQIFMQLADGVDDATWLHHLQAGDYSRWVLDVLKDRKLAEDIRKVERKSAHSPKKSRSQVRALIEKRYAPTGL